MWWQSATVYYWGWHLDYWVSVFQSTDTHAMKWFSFWLYYPYHLLLTTKTTTTVNSISMYVVCCCFDWFGKRCLVHIFWGRKFYLNQIRKQCIRHAGYYSWLSAITVTDLFTGALLLNSWNHHCCCRYHMISLRGCNI